MKIIRLNENDLKNIILRVISEDDKDVVCKNCGWSWNIEDSDPNPYLCHKCGHENVFGETDEGVGPYDAPAFEMEPDHVHFKHQYNEQDEIEYVSFDFDPESEEKQKNDFLNAIPNGPGRVLNTRFKGKPFKYTEGPLTVEYTIDGIGPGIDFSGGAPKDFGIPQGTTEIGGWGYVNKVLFKDNDVTEFNRYIDRYRDSVIKNNVSRAANKEVYKIAKNFGITNVDITF